MAIIGYDGRLRPAGRALNVGAPNEFDAGAIEKISNAQPKFVEETMKLLNTAAGDAGKYGNTLARIAEEEDELKGEEAFAAERRRVEDEMREIRENDSLDANAKQEKAGGVVFNTPKTGRERFDKRLAIRGKDFIHSQLMSIYNVAESERDNARRAALEADKATTEASIRTELAASLPSILNNVNDINQSNDAAKTFLKDKYSAASFNNTENKQEVDRFKAGMEAVVASAIGAGFVKKQEAEKKASAETRIAGAAAGATSVGEAMAIGKATTDDLTYASVFPTDGAKARTVVATGISYSENKYNSITQTVEAESDMQIKNASVFLSAGDASGYDNAVREANAYVVKQYDGLIASLEADKTVVIEEINGNEKIGEEDKNAMRGLAAKKYDELIRKAKNKKTADITKLRNNASSSKKKAGEEAFGSLQKSLRGNEDAELTPLACDTYVLLTNPRGFQETLSKEYPVVQGVKEAYLKQNFPNMNTAAAVDAAVFSFQYRIASIDMNSKNEQNIEDVKSVLVSAAQVFGLGSSEYTRIAKYARDNIVHEKNSHAEQIGIWIDEEFYKGKTKREWEKSVPPSERFRLLRFKTLLSEFHGDKEAWMSYAEKLSSQLSIDRSFDLAMGGKDLGESIASADGMSRDKTAKESAIAVSVDKKKSFYESLYDTYADDPLALGQAIVQHRQKQQWEQDLAEYEYRAELSGDKAELDALKRGLTVSQAEGVRAAAEQGFWRDAGREFGAYYHGRYEGWWSQGRQAVVDGLKKRAEQEEKMDKASREHERQQLLRELEKAGLPLSRKEYNSIFGIGGYSLNDSDEIELSGAFREDRELSNDEIREVLAQLSEIRKKEKRKAPEVEAAKKRIAELEAKRK